MQEDAHSRSSNTLVAGHIDLRDSANRISYICPSLACRVATMAVLVAHKAASRERNVFCYGASSPLNGYLLRQEARIKSDDVNSRFFHCAAYASLNVIDRCQICVL